MVPRCSKSLSSRQYYIYIRALTHARTACAHWRFLSHRILEFINNCWRYAKCRTRASCGTILAVMVCGAAATHRLIIIARPTTTKPESFSTTTYYIRTNQIALRVCWYASHGPREAKSLGTRSSARIQTHKKQYAVKESSCYMLTHSLRLPPGTILGSTDSGIRVFLSYSLASESRISNEGGRLEWRRGWLQQEPHECKASRIGMSLKSVGTTSRIFWECDGDVWYI